MDYRYFGTPYGMGICNLQSEVLRMELAETGMVMVDAINRVLCLAHVKMLKDCGNGKSAFNMLLQYQIEGQVPMFEDAAPDEKVVMEPDRPYLDAQGNTILPESWQGPRKDPNWNKDWDYEKVIVDEHGNVTVGGPKDAPG